ncbi:MULTISPECIES: GNAT family N-acetyltransferase [unclassified Saccharicrinis]|uniref:GNAT family N-acetyltransferase n=1 Tax=unclassified Saccharicrinis TaxID=2646859 RepID=UPI003D32E085
MQIIVVDNRATRAKFLRVVEKIYEGDEHYIRPLDSDVENIFNPKVNVFFKQGSAVRFVLEDKGEVIGRIAAFVNEKKAYGYEQPTGGLGFFECINNQEAAFKLFEAGVEWLKSKGMEAADGPINFGENDNFWGLLVEGFTDPTYGMQYNPPYYKKFYETYGFENYFEQVTNKLDLKKPFPERFWKIAEWIGNKPDYEFKHLTWDKKDKFIRDMVEIYNDAWKFHENFTPLSKEKVEPSFDKAKPIALEELLWFAYYKGEPVGFILMYPDVNQIFKHFNGKLNLVNKLRFLWLKRKNTMTRLRVVILGVKTKFQKSGVESGLFYHLRKPVFSRTWFSEMELSWVGDFNPKMRALQDSMGAEFSKKHITYRLIFDPSKRNKVRASAIPRDSKERVLRSKAE